MNATYVAGTVECIVPGSDARVSWLMLRVAHGGLLCAIFDYQGISCRLMVGREYELALGLTYPCQHGDETSGYWSATVAHLMWPRLPAGIARAAPVYDKLTLKRRRPPTGPTCVLVQTPFGALLSSVSQLQHYLPAPVRVGNVAHIHYHQRLDLLAILG